MEEKELVQRCIQQDKIAQELVFSRYADRFFRLAFRYVKDQEEAEDVLIVAFTKIFASLGKFTFQGAGSLEAWMKRVVVNEALMSLRKRHNFNLTESLDANTPEPVLEDFAALETEEIYAAIEALPTGYRTVFNLFVVEGFGHEEIAAMLNISVGTSRSQLFKARSILKKSLNEEGVRYGN
ncbi:MAG: sigma-70 family RNA polymerase sigma factor [Bacteroidota bacterium]